MAVKQMSKRFRETDYSQDHQKINDRILEKEAEKAKKESIKSIFKGFWFMAKVDDAKHLPFGRNYIYSNCENYYLFPHELVAQMSKCYPSDFIGLFDFSDTSQIEVLRRGRNISKGIGILFSIEFKLKLTNEVFEFKIRLQQYVEALESKLKLGRFWYSENTKTGKIHKNGSTRIVSAQELAKIVSEKFYAASVCKALVIEQLAKDGFNLITLKK